MGENYSCSKGLSINEDLAVKHENVLCRNLKNTVIGYVSVRILMGE